MAQKRKPYSQLKRTAKFYRDNPEALKKQRKMAKKINSRPEQIKKRVEANRARRKAKRAGKDIANKDASHTKNGIKFKHYSKNRGSKSDSAGDARARRKGRKMKKK